MNTKDKQAPSNSSQRWPGLFPWLRQQPTWTRPIVCVMCVLIFPLAPIVFVLLFLAGVLVTAYEEIYHIVYGD